MRRIGRMQAPELALAAPARAVNHAATMIRDDPALLTAPRANPGAWPLSDFDGALQAPSLVLFVGPAVRPDRAITELLAPAGLRCAAVGDLAGAHAACAQLQFDAAVVDAAVLWPTLALGLAGLHLSASCPLLVMAAQSNEVDEIVALEHGAAHYGVLPLSPRLLRAQLVAQLRPRLAAEAASPALAAERRALAGWVLDPLQRQLSRGARQVELTDCQFALLHCLATQVGRVVPRAQLEAQVRGPDNALTARAIDVYVHRLRRRLAEQGITELDIESVRGRGYRLRCRQN